MAVNNPNKQIYLGRVEIWDRSAFLQGKPPISDSYRLSGSQKNPSNKSPFEKGKRGKIKNKCHSFIIKFPNDREGASCRFKFWWTTSIVLDIQTPVYNFFKYPKTMFCDYQLNHGDKERLLEFFTPASIRGRISLKSDGWHMNRIPSGLLNARCRFTNCAALFSLGPASAIGLWLRGRLGEPWTPAPSSFLPSQWFPRWEN